MSMPRKTPPSKPGLLARLSGAADLRAEKARLEAFLDSVPAAWCGVSPEGMLAYSGEFASLLGLKTIGALSDIQNALSPSDAAVLEGLFTTLQEKGQTFTVEVRTAAGNRTLKLSGRRGYDISGADVFDTLWLEDISALVSERASLRAAQDKMTEETQRLQAALDQMSLPLWMRDARTDIVWCNRAYAQACDSSPATVVAEQKELPVKAASKQASARLPGKAQAQAALDSGKAEEARAHIIIGGRRRLMTIVESPLPGRRMTLGSAHDITREEELETEQKRYAAANKELLEQLGTAIGIFDAGQQLEFYNSAFARLWTLEDKYLNTRPRLGDLMEKLRETRRLPEQADFKRFKQSWLGMFTNLLQPHEEMLYLPDGSALRLLAVAHPMGGLMMTFEDVTSRLELESSYNTLVAVQKETLDNLAEGVAVFGGDARLKFWNPSFARLWSLNPEDLEGEPHVTRLTEKMKPCFTPEDWPKWQKKLAAQCIDRNSHEGRLDRSDGTLIHYATMPLPDGGVLVTHADVTDTVKVETALREKNMALETAERLKIDFLANVSYQLRTPLNAIMGFNEILSNEYFGKINEKQREYTTGMQEASERLLNLIDDILDLSTIEAGYMNLNREDVPVNDMLQAIHDLTQDWARKEKIELRFSPDPQNSPVNVDESRMKQALLNLVRNAIAFTPEGGTITLRAGRTDTHVTLSVADTGSGVAREDQLRIFEAFERARNATQGGPKGSRGAGLGLTLVRNIVEMHGGRVGLESAEGQGATFTIYLPLVRA